MYTFDEDYFSVERCSPESERAEMPFLREQRPYAFNQKLQVPVYRCWLSGLQDGFEAVSFYRKTPRNRRRREMNIFRDSRWSWNLVLSKTLEQDVARANLHLKKYWK